MWRNKLMVGGTEMKTMKVKRSRGERIFTVFNYIFLSLIMLLCLYPVWYVVVASFSDSNMLTQHTGLLLKQAGLWKHTVKYLKTQ